MSDLLRLQIYDEVNKCETHQELANVIRSIKKAENPDHEFFGISIENVAKTCENFSMAVFFGLPKSFGIRQQAAAIEFQKLQFKSVGL